MKAQSEPLKGLLIRQPFVDWKGRGWHARSKG